MVVGKNISGPLIFAIVIMALIVAIPCCLLSHSYCDLSVTNNSSEELLEVDLILDKVSAKLLNLQVGETQRMHTKIGLESSLAVVAKFRSGRMLKAENLLWVDDLFSTQAQIDVTATKIIVHATEQKFFLKTH
jgi:hypothetical protein